MKRKTILFAVLLSSVTAFSVWGATRMQPGLWKMTVNVDLGQAMPQISPQVAAAMKARGMNIPMPGAPMTMQVCITPEQAAMDRPPMTPQQMQQQTGCTVQNVRKTANSVSSDMVCTGERMQGHGTTTITYKGMTHSEGQSTFQGTASGRPISTKTTFLSDFVSANCGSVKPVQIPANTK